MSKVWVIESGSYSDYSVDAVFSNEDAARRTVEQWNRVETPYDEYEVSEWEVSDVPLLKEPRWNGEVTIRNDGTVSGPHTYSFLCHAPFEPVNVVDQDMGRTGHWRVFVSGCKTEREATQILSDRLAQEKARREGIA